MPRFRTSTFAAAFLTAALGWASASPAQDPADKPKDSDLDAVLEKIEGTKKADEPAAPADKKAGEKDKNKAGDKDKPKADGDKKGGDVAPKDEALDSLLEQLGGAEDKPSPDGKPQPPGAGGDDDPKPGAKKPDPLKKEDKTIDERLEELTGRKKKDKRKQQQNGGGPLDETIKQMREVQKRLGEPDTGEETRQKQDQIVKNIDKLIEQIRRQSQSGQGKPTRMVQGNQPGNRQNGNNPGTNPGNGQPLNQKPKTPPPPKHLAGDKNAWGHLPPEMRTEMDNVFQEKPLQGKEQRIGSYYESILKKTLALRPE